METRLKRFLSLALAIVMVIGMMPTNIVYATETEGTQEGTSIEGTNTEPSTPEDTSSETCKHENATTETVAASCIAEGSVTVTCECGYSSVETIAKVEHSYGEGVETTAATCTTAGVKTFTCTVEGCGATKTEEIAVLAHTYTDGVCSCGATKPPAETEAPTEAPTEGEVAVVAEVDPVAKIGEQGYETFDAALTAAAAMSGVVTIEIYGKVTLKQPLNGSYSSIKFVGEDTDAEIYMDIQGYIDAPGKKVAFEGLKLSKVEGGHITNAGFMNLAFGIYSATETTYTNCTFLNGAYASYGKVTFTDCTFYRSHDRYGLWAYGANEVIVDGCTFADIRGIKVYDEGKQQLTGLTVKNTDFSAVTDKPAIVLTSGKSVALEGNTYNPSKGVFELDLDGNPDGTTVTYDVAPTCVNDNGACGVLVDGKIYTTVAQAAEVATSGSTVTLLHNSAETVELAEGVTLEKNGFEAANVTVAAPSETETPAKPQAEVTKLDPLVLNKYMVWPSGDDTIDRPLQIVMNFKAKESLEEATAGGYGKYICDFYLQVTGLANGSMEADNCYLAGNYGDFGWIVIPADDIVLENNIFYPIVSAYDANLTYEDICGSVKDFTAAIFIDPDLLAANPDMRVTLELRMTNPDDANDVLVIGNPAVYTVADLLAGTPAKPPVVVPDKVDETVAKVPENSSVTLEQAKDVVEDVVSEVAQNSAISEVTENVPEGAEFIVELKSVEVDKVGENVVPTKLVFDVAPKMNGETKQPEEGKSITFRLPVPADWEGNVKVIHDGIPMSGNFVIAGEGNAKYVEVYSAKFSVFAVELVTAPETLPTYVVLPEGMDAGNYKAKFGTNTVTDGTNYYATLQAAVEAIADAKTVGATLYCMPAAEVGSLQHAPVISTLTVYGNGASVTGGAERDFDIGNTDPSGGKDITADMTLAVKYLNGCGAWGAKATEHTVNLVFENCQNMGKVFITGTTGDLNVTMTDCSFEGIIKEAVYTNADGAVTLTNVDFSNLNKAINLNHKATGTMTVVLDGCTFTNCGNDVSTDQIPVRVLSSVAGGKSVLTVSDCEFTGTPEGGADILLDYGVGETNAAVSGTTANVTVETATNESTTTEVKADEDKEFTNVVPSYVAQVGETQYETLAEALAAVTSDTQEVVILTDITENLTGAYLRGNIVTKDNAKVTINLTNTDWVYCPYNFVLGENITLNVPALFYYAGGAVIKGEVVAGAYYQRYAGTKLTIEAPGSMTVTGETCIIRYMDGDPNAGIYIIGDNDDDTVELKLSVAYFYQGMINAKNATIVVGTYWQTNETDGQGSANLVLDNSKLNVTVNELDAKATGTSTVTLKNGSAMTCAGGMILGNNTTVNVDKTSDIIAKGKSIFAADVNGVKYESLQAAIDAATEGATVTLLADVTLDAKQTIDKSVTLDLNSKTITGANKAIALEIAANVTIEDGTVTGNVTGNSNGVIRVTSGKLILNEVILTQTGSSRTNRALRVNNGAVAKLNNCTVTGFVSALGVAEIRDGMYYGLEAGDSIDGAGIAVYSGTFYYELMATDAAPGYVVVKNGETWTVEYDPACFVDANKNGTLDEGEALFGSLEEIFTTYRSGDVYIVLLKDIEIENQVDTNVNAKYYLNAAEGVTVTFKHETGALASTDAEGNAISAKDQAWNFIQNMYIGENVTLNSKYLLLWGDVEIAGTVNTTYLYTLGATVDVLSTGVVNVANGEATVQVKTNTIFTVDGALNAALLQVWNNNAKLVINGDVTATNIRAWDGAPVIIVGENANVESEKFTLADRATVQGPAGLNITTTVDDHKVNYEGGSYGIVECNYVAQVGEQKFESLAAAIAAANANDTITLLADVSLSSILTIDKSITLDGNGKKLTSTAGRAINVSGANGVTIKNLTINTTGERAINIIQNATNVTIENVTATAANYTVNVAGSAANAVVAIKNSTLNGLCTVNASAAGVQVTVDNSTINCNDNNTTAGEAYAALSLNKDAVGGSIVATTTTVNVAEGSDSMKGRNGAENGTVTINGSTDGVVTMVAAITYPNSDNYHAFATLKEAVEFAKVGETITLIRDVTTSKTVNVTKDVTIDGNGKTLTYTGSDRAITVEASANGANLTLKNLTVDCTASYCQRGINYNTNGKLTLDKVTVNGTNVTYALNLPGSSDNAVVTITDGNISGNIALNAWGENSKIEATNTIFTAVDNNTAEGYAAVKLNNDGAGNAAEGTVINITGGKIDVTGTACADTEAVSNATTTGKINISDSTVVNGVSAEMVAIISYGDNFYSFTTLADAVAFAKDGETVVLLRDVTASEIITINKAITLDGNGKKLTSTAARAINVSGANGVTIKNLTIDAKGERAINIIQNATNVTIDNVTATAANYTVNVAGSAANAAVVIKNSTLNGLCTVNVSAAGAQVTVDNSTINCNDNNTTVGEAYAALSLNKEAVGGSIVATNSIINVPEGSDSNKGRNGAENGTVTINGSTDGVVTMVAAITYPNSDNYHAFATLQAAVEFAKAGQTITLIRDVTTSKTVNVTKDVTIDGNGKTLTYTGSNRAIDIPANTNEKVGVTFNNLTVNCTASYCERGINYNDDGALTLDRVTVMGTNVTYALNLPGSSDNATVVINNSALTGNIALNVWGEDATITATDTVFTSVDNTEVENYAAIVLNNDGITIANGTTISIDGGKIIALDENDEPSNAIRNSTATGKVTVGESTEVVGKIVEPVAIVTYGASQFYSCATLQAAIDRVEKDGRGTIELIADVTETSVTVNGNVTMVLNGKSISGEIKLGANATLTAPEGLTVTTDVADHKVVYENGIYSVVECHYVAQVGKQKFESLTEAIAAANADETITLLANVELTATATIDKIVTLDLNGHVISGTKTAAAYSSLIHVANTGTLTVKDSAGEGKISYAAGISGAQGAVIWNEGDLVLESGTLETTGTWSIGYAVDVRPNAWSSAYTNTDVTFTMNGGKIKTSDAAIRVANNCSDDYADITVSFTMNGGEVASAATGIFIQQLTPIYDDLKVIIKGGEITTSTAPIRFQGEAAPEGYRNGTNGSALTIEGGNIAVGTGSNYTWAVNGMVRVSGSAAMADQLADADITVSETFAQNNNELADGYKWAEKDGAYVLAVCNYVAQIGTDGPKFESLQDAIKVVEKDGIIVLLADFTGEDNVVSVNKPLTIKKNGFEITEDNVSCLKWMNPATGKKTQLTTEEDDDKISVILTVLSNEDAGAPVAYIVGDESNLMPLQTALNAANAGDVVKLTADLTVNATVIIPTDVTLDIEAHTLSVTTLVGLNGSKLTAGAMQIDGTGSGKLIVEKDNLLLLQTSISSKTNMAILPVWMNGYYQFAAGFTTYEMTNQYLKVTEDTISLRFRHRISSYYKTIMPQSGGLAHGMKVVVKLTWENPGNGVAEQVFVYNDSMFKTVADDKHDYTFELTNYKELGIDLEQGVNLTMGIITDCGVETYHKSIQLALSN